MFERFLRRDQHARQSQASAAALLQSEARFRALVENASEAMSLLSAEGKRIYVNASVERMLGYTQAELIGHSPLELVHPDDCPGVQNAFDQLLQTPGATTTIHFRFRHKDGTWRWIDGTGKNLLNDPDIQAIVVTYRDVTPLRKSETEIAQLAALNREIIQNIAEGIIVTDRAGNFTFVNPAAAALLGYPPDELIGKHWLSIVPADLHAFAQVADKRRLQDESDQYELQVVRKDGARLSLFISATPRFENGQWAGSLAVFTDITERKRAEQALRESESIYHRAIEAANAVPYVQDYALAAYTFMGEGIRAITGYAAAEMTPQIWASLVQDMIPLGAATGLSKAEALERARRGEFKIWRCDMRIQTRDGETRWVTDAAVEICDDAGVQRSSIGILQDITERKRAEEILRHNEDQYRDLVEASPMIIVLHDLDGTILSANPAAVQLFGGTTAEFTHLNVQDILAPRVRDQFERYLTTVQQNGYASGLMLVQTRADEERLLEYTSTLRTEGVSTPIVRAMARDVTELKRAERAQTRLAKQMAALYATSLEINAQMDLAQLLPTIVRRAADLVGASSGALYLLQPDNQTLKLFASHNMRGDYAGATLRLGEGLAGRVAQTGCPVMVEDHSQWEERAALFADAPFRQVLGVPLKSGNRVIGVLNVVDIEKAGAYQEEEIRLVSLLADQAAIAIENARLLAETQARADEFTALYETARDLMTQNDLNTLLRTIVTRATTLLKSKTGSIFLYDAERGDLELVVAQSDQIASRARLKLGEGMAGRVALSRQPLIVDNYSTWEHRLPEYNQIFFTAALQVPMIYGGELIGVLDVSEVGTFTRKFSETDARLLSLFAAQAASAVYNTRLLQQTRQRAEQLALLYDAVLTINRALEPHQIIEHLMQLIRQSVRAERADLFGYDPIQHTLIFEDGSGSSAELESLLRSLKFTEGNVHGLVGLVAQDRTPLYLPNVTVDSRWIPIDATIRSALWMPVEREKQLYGVLMITSPHLNAFAPADQRLVALFANQVAVTLERAHLSQTEQNRRAELTALYDLSRALADTDSRDAILKLVVRFAVETLRVTFARLALLERDTLIVEAVQPIRLLEHNLGIGSRNTETHLPGCQRALDQNQIMLLDATDPQISAPERDFLLLDLAKTLALVPLRSGGQTLGLLMLGEMRHPERKPFAVEQMRLARNIGDQAASALRRTKLREQIEHRLSQLQALHTIDLTINASLDLSVTLEVLLTQVTDQAGAAAADILAFNPQTQMLTYLAGRGFRSKGIETAQLRLGKEYAGRAALECRIVSEPDLPARRESLLRGFLHSVEGFVSCVCVPLIAKGQVKGVLEIFYRTPFQPDSEWLELVETLGTQAAIAIDNAELFDRLQRSNLELALAHDATIAGWSRALELRDPAPAGRTLRVTALTLRLARALGMREPELIHLRHGALLHDVGALSIPDTLWRKRGALTPEETQIVQEHPSQAHAILSSIPYLRPILDIPYCHHERWDGQGYPRGLAGEQIPLAARIFAVADAWDALTAEQPGQPAQTPNQARAYLQEMAGKIFDPRVVKAFLPLAEEIHNEQK